MNLNIAFYPTTPYGTLAKLLEQLPGSYETAAEMLGATGESELLNELTGLIRERYMTVAKTVPIWNRIIRWAMIAAARHNQRDFLENYGNNITVDNDLLNDCAAAAAEGGHHELFFDLIGNIKPQETQWNRLVAAAIDSEDAKFAWSVFTNSNGRADDFGEFELQAFVRNMDELAGDFERLLSKRRQGLDAQDAQNTFA